MNSILIACLAKKIIYVYLYFMNSMHERGGMVSYILKLQCLSVRLSVHVGSAWKILPVTARSLWSW
jgi:hypothetical protein